jgi:hypothetical protein
MWGNDPELKGKVLPVVKTTVRFKASAARF